MEASFFTELSNFIKEIGFPIAAFVLIWWDNRESRKADGERLEQLTAAINALSAKLGTEIQVTDIKE